MKNKNCIRITFFAWLLMLACAHVQASVQDSLIQVLSTQTARDTNRVNALVKLGRIYYQNGEQDNARSCYQQALSLSDSIRFERGQALSLNGMAILFRENGDFQNSIKYQQKSIALYEKLGNMRGLALGYLNMGGTHFYQQDFEQALHYYKISLTYSEKIKLWDTWARANDNIAGVFHSLNMMDSAEYYFRKALNQYEKTGDPDAIGAGYSNFSILFAEKKDYKNALLYAEKGLTMLKQTGNKNTMGDCYATMARALVWLKDYSRALKVTDTCLSVAQELRNPMKRMEAYEVYTDCYQQMGNMEQAVFYFEKYVALKDSVLSSENAHFMSEMATRFDNEKKQKEIVLLSKENEIKTLKREEEDRKMNKRRSTIYFLFAFFAVSLVLAIFTLRSFKKKRKIYAQLGRINEEMVKRTAEIAAKNNLIADSIEYAREIQNAVLPDEENLLEQVGAHFVLYAPKDVVSGDFYWVKKSGQKRYFAVVDCTGHGVPGAFMSILALNMMENILSEIPSGSTAAILDALNVRLAGTLNADAKRPVSKFGMDVSLCSAWESPEKPGEVLLEFSGAHQPALVYSQGQLTEMKGDKIFPGMSAEKFSLHRLTLQKGDAVYLFTDGATDQFGEHGGKREKLFSYRFREWILSVAHLPLHEQKQKLQQLMQEWKGNREQIDDVLVMCVKL